VQGPFKTGTLVNSVTRVQGHWESRSFVRGEIYRVVKSFVDAEGDPHLVGESWIFIGAMFSKFDNELTVCIRLMSGEEWKFSLIWKKDKQQDVIEHWRQYVVP
jgi:hypothetical protein